MPNPKKNSSYTIQELDLTMMPINSGSFIMGSDVGASDEKPVHRVTISKNFWMGRTEVTQSQFRKIMGTNPSFHMGDDLPVENVNWNDAVSFCEKLTERERRAGRLPSGYVYRLPTEAEWEFCCRAGTTGKYAGDLDSMAWYSSNSGRKTHAVGTKQANAWGLYDMHGNVWEWCFDWYDAGYYSRSSQTDPSGVSSGSFRVGRGGSWGSSASYCRSAYRDRGGPTFRFNDYGFRVVLGPSVP